MVTNGLNKLARLGAVVAVVACTTQCQCLVPVDEGDDAGARDASVVGDAGRDASMGDASVECVTPADCRGQPWATQWCNVPSPDAGFSCVNGRCVSTCSDVSNDVCTVDAGHSHATLAPEAMKCLRCEREGLRCPRASCETERWFGPGMDRFSRRVSSVECRPGVAPPIALLEELEFQSYESLMFQGYLGVECLLFIRGQRGVGLGTATVAPADGTFFAWHLPSLGGWCVSHQLQTGALRSSVACPLCTFVIEGL